ncbi:facilitated trehalose transporter Tret1-like [Thrips palmi]|uniref:Facilitated trehalose transporter Tret1-like n=1 Tax=Thrips palmi TaxID=161013 RepID=A0A6P9AIL1_THRPL|nr:facilitated trehalose transporter Tret1-like [Thrips palmi]
MALSEVLVQVKSCSGVMMLTFIMGMGIGWASPGMEKMEADEAPFGKAEMSQISQIVSIFDIGAMLGSWTSTLVFTVAGRKQTILVGPVALTLWVVFTAIGTSPGMLIAARILAGMSMGIVLSFAFIYAGEVTTPKVRGPLILATTLLMPTGQLVAFLTGPQVNWLAQSVYPAPFVAILFLCIFFLMEESPFYYASKNRPDDVVKSLRALRRNATDQEIRNEADTILGAIRQEREDAVTIWQMFSPPGAKKAALIVLVESSSLALLGVTCVLAYTNQIFTKTNGTIISATLSGVLVIVFEIFAICFAMYLIERLGRRLQMCVAASVTCLSMTVLAVYCGLMEIGGHDMTAYNWVPLACLLAFIVGVGGGINTIPQVLMSELLDQRAKAVVAPVCMTIMALTSFGINYAFLPVTASYGTYVPFAFFAATNFLIGLFTLLVVPETKGKTLVQVQEMLRGRRSESKEVL